SVELWSGSFFIGDGADSTRRGAGRREQADFFYRFHAPFSQAHELERYKRQYYGCIREGKELIYGNFYCDDTPLSCNPREVDDGGECYIRALFDVKAKKVILFHRNGKA